MSLILGFINTFSTIRVLVFGLALSVLTGAGGYVAGRIDGRTIERAAAAAAAEAIRRADSSFAQEEAKRAKEAAEALGKQESNNDATEDVLSQPEAGDDNPCLSDKWLRGLEAIR